MTIDAAVLIGEGPDSLEGTKVTTPAGTDLFREGVVISDPDNAQGRANVKTLGTQLSTADKGLVVNAIIHGETTGGGGGYRDVKVNPSGALVTDATGSTVALDAASLAALENISATVSGTVSVGNTVAVSATDLDIRNLSSAQDSVAVTDGGGSITVDGSVSVANFPATQAVSGTVALDSTTLAALETIQVGNFPAVQQVSGTVTANLGTLNGAATAANQTTTNTTLASIDNKTPDESGTWGYNAGVSGTLAVAANKRILAITATSSPLTAASMTINGGQTITIPAGTTITISPRANLTAPTLVFTSTTSYFVEFIE